MIVHGSSMCSVTGRSSSLTSTAWWLGVHTFRNVLYKDVSVSHRTEEKTQYQSLFLLLDLPFLSITFVSYASLPLSLSSTFDEEIVRPKRVYNTSFTTTTTPKKYPKSFPIHIQSLPGYAYNSSNLLETSTTVT